jgi:hypothetical protein
MLRLIGPSSTKGTIMPRVVRPAANVVVLVTATPCPLKTSGNTRQGDHAQLGIMLI